MGNGQVVMDARVALDRIAAAAPALSEEVARLGAFVDELERTQGRLRDGQTTLMNVARSEHIGRGDLKAALREIAEATSSFLGVERSSVWLYNADQSAIQCVEIFVRTERSHESGVELFARDFPGYFEALKSERTIAAHDAHTDSRTAEFSEVYLTPLGIASMLDAPIRVGGRMIGVTCNEQVGSARTWTPDEEQFAASVADLIALALESSKRRETEEQLRAMVEALEADG